MEIRTPPTFPAADAGAADAPEDDRAAFLDALERLGTTEAAFRSLAERLPAVVFLEAVPGMSRTIYVSPAVEGLVGVPPDEWVRDGGCWAHLVDGRDLDRVVALSARSDLTGEPFVAEYRMQARDGRTVWVHEESTLVDDAAGQPICWYGVMVDVTERKEAEERAREAEDRYRSVVENLPAALYTEDLDPTWFGTTYVSPQIEAITGYPPQDWVDDPDLWVKVIHPDDLERAVAADRAVADSGGAFEQDLRLVRPDGSIVWVHDTAVLIRDADGEPSYWLGFFHDVTAMKQAEEELARALEVERESTDRLRLLDEMKDTFLTAVSHELRSPLAAILGSAMTLDELGGSISDEERRDMVRAVINQTRKLRGLVEDLLDLDRLRHGMAVARRSPADLPSLVREVLSSTGLERRREVTLDLPPMTIPVDRPMIERILDNLLTNAERYTPPGSRIWVRLVPSGDGVEVVVEDDGPGVPDELKLALFEPFRQGPNALTHSPGVGVGLSLVARFAELHGGRAWIEDRTGGGASFHVVLAHERPA